MKERLTIYIRFILKSKFLLPPKKYYKKFQFYYFIQIKKPRIYFIRGFYTILQKVVVLPRFELRQTEPKTVVLPLHHRTNTGCFLLKSGAKIEVCPEICKYFGTFFHQLLLFRDNQVIILLTTLYQQILIVQQISSCNNLIESDQLLLV